MVYKCQGLLLFWLRPACLPYEPFQSNLPAWSQLRSASLYSKQVNALHVVMFKLGKDLQVSTKPLILTWIFWGGMDLCWTYFKMKDDSRGKSLLDRKYWNNSGVGLPASTVSHSSIKISPCINTVVYLWPMWISKFRISTWEIETNCPPLSYLSREDEKALRLTVFRDKNNSLHWDSLFVINVLSDIYFHCQTLLASSFPSKRDIWPEKEEPEWFCSLLGILSLPLMLPVRHSDTIGK